MSECGDIIAAKGEVTKSQAEEILKRVANMARQRSQMTGEPLDQATKNVTGQLKAHDEMLAAVNERNAALSVLTRQNFRDFVSKFRTAGEGIMAFLEGRNRDVEGARRSVDYQQKAIQGKYTGKLVAELESAGLLRQFRDNSLMREIYQEMGEIKDGGHPGISKSPEAQQIAKILDGVTKDMVSRQNRAGAYIGNLPGYVVRQTHDVTAIRDLGRGPDGQPSKAASLDEWSKFTLPLLDQAQTFLGDDPGKFMRNVHEGIYTGVHGGTSDYESTGGFAARGDIAGRVSRSRVLHFRDADSAFVYNERFGSRDLREQVLTDIHTRARSIGLMENLGPVPEDNLIRGLREVKELARARDDAAKQLDSINDHKVWSAFHQLTGVNSIPANPTLARISQGFRAVAQLSKMGSVLMTNLFSDRAFLQSEMAYQGISNMTTLAKQLGSLAKRTPDERQALRLMGIGMDGLLGNALSRFSPGENIGGVLDKVNRKFFDLNFHNYWTDNTKSAAAELMSAHLGEHADVTHADLPPELSRVLGMYGINAPQWDLIRKTATDGRITPDGLDQLNLGKRDRDQLETSLRTYFQDRVDFAVPTPGASERRILLGDTRAGTPLGEAIRLMMIFKAFPATVANKIMTRDVYGRGATSAMDWLMNDHQGKFHMASLIAMTTIAGYLGNSMRAMLNGKTPPELASDGKINADVLGEAAIRGGGLGLMGDLILKDYEHQTSSLLENIGGPVLGQADLLATTLTRARHGEPIGPQVGKMITDNMPFINLFYVRPALNYYVLWNIQQMMDPNRIERMRHSAEMQHEQYFMGPAAR